MTQELRKTGIAAVGDLPWGTHFCHFYETRVDLFDIVLPYLKAGVESNERCLWVTAEPVDDQIRNRLRRAIPAAEEHLAAGDIEIFPYSQWYLQGDSFDARRVIDAWDAKLAQALARGYAGLRVAADEAWLGKRYWQAFAEYERTLNAQLGNQRMIVQCAYPLVANDGAAIFDVAHTHQFAIAERNGSWETLETSELRQAKAELTRLNEELEQRVVERTTQLAATNTTLRQEIDERRRTEEALRQSRQQLQAILDNTTAVVYVKDPEGRYLMVNPRYEELFHVSGASVVGRTDFDLFPPEQAEAFRAFDRRVLAAGTALEEEEGVSHDDGLHTYISIKCPLFDAAGRPYAVCGISTDITERKRAEAERQAREAAEAASRMKSEFLANMSHELRTPLNAVLGYAQLLMRDAALSERQTAGLATIRQSGEHLLTLINDLLDLARIEAGKLELHPGPLNPAEFLQAVGDVLRVRTEEKDLRFACEAAPELPPAVLADEQRLRQILLNLLGNAVKFTDQGEVRLRLALLGRDSATVRLRFEVADTGVGIAPEQLAVIFQPFEQVGAIERRAAGSGLGLAISRRLARMMGAEIEVASEPGAGSRFWFDLALPLAEAATVSRPAARRYTGYAGARRTVLIADDVADSRAMLVATLTRLGFQVAEAADGRAALALARTAPPDLVVMDLVMPGMDGLAAIRAMRHSAGLGRLPIIAVSAAAGGENHRDSLAAGADDFFPKPLDHDALLGRIGELLGLAWVQGEAQDAAATQQALPLLVPPPEELEVLYKLALTGDMREIRAWAESMAARDARYGPFAERLRGLALACRSKAILDLVQQHRNKAGAEG